MCIYEPLGTQIFSEVVRTALPAYLQFVPTYLLPTLYVGSYSKAW